ncbi:MAG: heat-inducible transcriptional repressor HrcA [Microbacteriaceae bacterium]|nr:heat-inducible transcriptional repressor HrcA [Microbacteriaceae bacterium]MCI1206796.1 heat-inducible transcriptional repressor HrcA [Microbacteriaceae bacterium]
MSADRKLRVLKAIVEDYISTQEPVGSKGLVERHHFDVSAATIRNDMAALEDEELISAPHTSAGRIPTEKGYRLFVDSLHRFHDLSEPQRRAIERFLSTAEDLDGMLEGTVRVLAQLTNQLAVVQYPTLGPQRMRYIGILPAARDRLLVILVTDRGRVQQQMAEIPEAVIPRVDDAMLDRVRQALLERLRGARLSEFPARSVALLDQLAPADRAVASAVLDTLGQQVDEHRSSRLLVAGAGNLLRTDAAAGASLASVLDALEEQVTLLRLMGELAHSGGQVGVSIGHENDSTMLDHATVVATPYGSPETPLGRLGIVGPTRMDYRANISTVRAVARYLNTYLS